jgi:hypothetical protein
MAHSNFHSVSRDLLDHANVTQALRHLADGGKYVNGQEAGEGLMNLFKQFPFLLKKLGLGIIYLFIFMFTFVLNN